MKKRIEKAAVLGAGTMGSQIAAHLANAGVSVILLDIVPPELSREDEEKGLSEGDPRFRNKFAREGLKRALKMSPPPFFIPEFASLITVGNFEDDLPEISEADWIIEAVVERMDIKRSLFERVDKYAREDAVISTNTSGLSINALAETLSDKKRKNFLGTHFFNPPRFMKLLEIIPSKYIKDEVLDFIVDFSRRKLGKGIVFAKDTPNFIANRLGVFGIMHIIRTMMEMNMTIEEVDAITGRPMGRPRSATFRTIDLVGVDVFLHVARNVYENAPDDEMRDYFKPPEFLEKMVEKGLLGDKSGGGFYKKEKDGTRLTLDWKTLEYRERMKPSFASVERAMIEETPEDRIRVLIEGKDKAAEFARKTLTHFLYYSAIKIPEISDSIIDVDNAIRWGFNFRLGPFETWDAVGVKRVLEFAEQEGLKKPPLVEDLLQKGESFYIKERTRRLYFDVVRKEHVEEKLPKEVIVIDYLKGAGREVLSNPEASLIDMGDGVALLEFHTKANALGPGSIQMVFDSLEKVRTDFDGMVIGNRGPYFSAGANLALIMQAVGEEEWDELDLMVRRFQEANMAIKYFEKPVVVAPFNRTLGGGAEVTMHGHAVQAAAELYMGLVEVAVGLLPAGGGTKEILLRYTANVRDIQDADLYPMLREALTTIGMAKVSMSAYEAKKLRYLKETDGITINDDFLLHDAKMRVLGMVKSGFRPPFPEKIRVTGESGFAYLKMLIYNLKEGKQITEHDAFIATEIARVLTGGDVLPGTLMTEQDILDLERESFLRLCGTQKTQERMAYMLEKGKPLRN